MAFRSSMFKYFIFLAVSVGAAQCMQPCNCTSEVLDCSFRMRTVLLESELYCSASRWIFRGNNLRSFPYVSTTVNHIDISNNELGLTDTKRLKIWYTTYLDVSGNRLKTLEFYEQCYLYHLNVSYNAIDSLNNIAVCSELRSLRIAFNNFTILSDNAFTSWSYLELLDVSGNPIISVSSTTFQSLNTLRILYLSETRSLQILSEGTFSSLTNLKHLFLNGNKLATLPEKLFQDLVNLEVLHLQQNKLQTLPETIFKSLVRLESLVLDNNQLLSLPDSLFSRLHSLQELSVRSNRLMNVPSVRGCLGPLRTALFNDNLITRVDEAVARSFFRHGFVLGDLRGNALRNDSLRWQSSADLIVLWDSSDSCGTIGLNPPGHGNLSVCICHPVPNEV